MALGVILRIFDIHYPRLYSRSFLRFGVNYRCNKERRIVFLFNGKMKITRVEVCGVEDAPVAQKDRASAS